MALSDKMVADSNNMLSNDEQKPDVIPPHTILTMSDLLEQAVLVDAGVSVYNDVDGIKSIDYMPKIGVFGKYLTLFSQTDEICNLTILDENSKKCYFIPDVQEIICAYDNSFVIEKQREFYSAVLFQDSDQFQLERFDDFSNIIFDFILSEMRYFRSFSIMYGNITQYFRLRGNILLTNDTETYALYLLDNNTTRLLVKSKNPLDLYVPELKNHKEPFVVDKKLYIHDVGSGKNELLGKTIYETILIGSPTPYIAKSGDIYLLDSVSLESYKFSKDLMKNGNWDNGFSYIHRISDNSFYYIDNTEYYHIFHFLIKDEYGKKLQDVLEIKGIEGTGENEEWSWIDLENAIYKNDKLYINLISCSLVYNIKTQIVENVFKLNTDSNFRVVHIVPFGDDLYLYDAWSSHERD
jgi:hypothetical protein